MAITLTPLPKIAFSRNANVVRMVSDRWIDTYGAKAVFVLDWTGPVVNGDYMQMTFDAEVVRLQADKYTIPGPIPFYVKTELIQEDDETRAVYAARIAAYFRSVYLLVSNYDISVVDDNKIVFTALVASARFNIVFEGHNFTLAQLEVGRDEVIRPNFRNYLEVWRSEAAGIKRVYAAQLPMNYPFDGSTTVDIQSILHAAHGVYVPDLAVVWQPIGGIYAFFLRYTEVWGDPQVMQDLSTSPVVYSAKGGYSKMALLHIAGDDHLERFLLPNALLYQAQRWFEAWPVDRYMVKTNQPQFIYFVNSRDVAEVLALKVVATFDDASVLDLFFAGGSMDPFAKVCVACGYKQLGLDGLATELKKVVSYTVQMVTDGHEARSLVKLFTVNRDYEAYTRYFLYEGSDGNFKTLRTYGTADAKANFDADTGVQVSTQARQVAFGDALTLDVLSYESEELNTGYIWGRRSLDAIKELMLSTCVFRVIGEKLVPVQITGKDMPLYKENAGFGSVKLEYRLAYDDTQYTGDSWALNVPPFQISQQPLNDI